MEIQKNTKIQYTFVDRTDLEDTVTMKFELQQIEGSTPNFYDHIKEVLKSINDKADWQIAKREIV